MSVALNIIDPQNDFCCANGALAVPNAEKQMAILAKSIADNLKQTDKMTISMDSHQPWQIFFKRFFKDKTGNNLKPFTEIFEDDIKVGKYFPAIPSKKQNEYARWYTCDLKKSPNQFTLMIWPDHTLIGQWGWLLYDAIAKVNFMWEDECLKRTEFITKGNSPYTEHYSPLKSEVILDGNNPLGLVDESTYLRLDFINDLKGYKKVGIAGQARSHCVRFFTDDVVNNFGADAIQNLFLLIDCCGDVPGFEQKTEEWMHEMGKKGLNLVTADQFWRA